MHFFAHTEYTYRKKNLKVYSETMIFVPLLYDISHANETMFLNLSQKLSIPFVYMITYIINDKILIF